MTSPFLFLVVLAVLIMLMIGFFDWLAEVYGQIRREQALKRNVDIMSQRASKAKAEELAWRDNYYN